MRRWIAALACLAALVALACDGSGEASPRPSGTPAPGEPRVLVALGDSVSTGYGSCLVLVSCERNSWSTGDGLRVESLYRRLRADAPGLRAYNRA
ncbi:SGNH/GDSL hydrolase family protein, partial [Micromonospora aurantiaca]